MWCRWRGRVDLVSGEVGIASAWGLVELVGVREPGAGVVLAQVAQLGELVEDALDVSARAVDLVDDIGDGELGPRSGRGARDGLTALRVSGEYGRVTHDGQIVP